MWYYNNVRIFVQDYKTDDSQIIARLSPLDAGTVIQYFGSDDQILNIKALIVGLTDYESIRGLKDNGAEYTLESPYFSNTDFALKSMKATLLKTICQSIRPDLAEDAPVFELELEFYRDE